MSTFSCKKELTAFRSPWEYFRIISCPFKVTKVGCGVVDRVTKVLALFNHGWGLKQSCIIFTHSYQNQHWEPNLPNLSNTDHAPETPTSCPPKRSSSGRRVVTFITGITHISLLPFPSLSFQLRLKAKGPDAAFKRLQGFAERVGFTEQVTPCRKSPPDPNLHNSSQNSHPLSKSFLQSPAILSPLCGF